MIDVNARDRVTFPEPPTCSDNETHFICTFRKREGGGLYKLEYSKALHSWENFLQGAEQFAEDHGWTEPLRCVDGVREANQRRVPR